jgi:hypothetical protein
MQKANIGQKPFADYGGKEWFEMCNEFDLWLIETRSHACR